MARRLIPAVLGLLLVATACVGGGRSVETADREPPWIDERSDGRILSVVEIEAHFADLSQWPDDWPAPDAFLAENLEASWPDDPTTIYIFQGGFQDPYYQVRFSLPADQLEAYRDTAVCDERLAPIKPVPSLAGDIDWWKPGDPEALTGCSLEVPGRSRLLQIDATDPAAPVVYLSLFTF